MNPRAGTALIDSPVGKLRLVARETGLTHVLFVDAARHPGAPIRATGPARASRFPRGDDTAAATAVLTAARRQLAEYFAGRRRDFDLPLVPAGTDFQLAVWRALGDIPFGATTSYGDVARRIGRPRAVRAVGAANGANPLSIVVPCHRVVGRDGRLTGYGGGLPAKQRLLKLEGVALSRDRVTI